MKAVLLLAVLAACPSNDPPTAPDAGVDAMPDVPQADFFGEPCDPPSSLGFVSLCRPESPYPKAYCTPHGVCRPFCDRVTIGAGYSTCEELGGNQTYAFPDSDARVCYCEPR